MAARPVLTYPSEKLNQVVPGVRTVNKTIQRLMQDLADSMYADGGIGLAGPQVGIMRRIIAVDTTQNEEAGANANANPCGLILLANPQLVDGWDVQGSVEGCLSLPGILVRVPRYHNVIVSGLNQKGKEVTIEASGLLAYCLQHEIEHLNGITLIEHVKRGDGQFVEPSKEPEATQSPEA